MFDVKRSFKYAIRIDPSDNGGAIVKIGCCTLVFDTTEAMTQGLDQYFSDPEKWEAEYSKLPGTVTNAEAADQPTDEVRRAA